MLKLSKLADYATVVMVTFGRNQQAQYTAKEVAELTTLSVPTVSKILKLLTNAGLLVSTRGIKGGYALGLDVNKISIADIIECIEGKPSLTECSEEHNRCVIQKSCQIKGNWQLVSQAIVSALQGVSLADFAGLQWQSTDFRVSLKEIGLMQNAERKERV